MSDVVHGAPRREGCTCPPDVDVMRGRGGETRPECPWHPTPPDLGRLLVPRVNVAGGVYDARARP